MGYLIVNLLSRSLVSRVTVDHVDCPFNQIVSGYLIVNLLSQSLVSRVMADGLPL